MLEAFSRHGRHDPATQTESRLLFDIGEGITKTNKKQLVQLVLSTNIIATFYSNLLASGSRCLACVVGMPLHAVTTGSRG